MLVWWVGYFKVEIERDIMTPTTPYEGKLLNQNRPDFSERFLGGDGGNRTRVRKIRPSDLYEHSQLFRFVRLQVN